MLQSHRSSSIAALAPPKKKRIHQLLPCQGRFQGWHTYGADIAPAGGGKVDKEQAQIVDVRAADPGQPGMFQDFPDENFK